MREGREAFDKQIKRNSPFSQFSRTHHRNTHTEMTLHPSAGAIKAIFNDEVGNPVTNAPILQVLNTKMLPASSGAAANRYRYSNKKCSFILGTRKNKPWRAQLTVILKPASLSQSHCIGQCSLMVFTSCKVRASVSTSFLF